MLADLSVFFKADYFMGVLKSSKEVGAVPGKTAQTQSWLEKIF